MAAYPNNKKGDPAEFEDVYAGPGMMDEINGEAPDEPEEIKEPAPETEKPREPDMNEFACVYAGPDYFGFSDDPDTVPEEDKEPEEEPKPEEEKKPELPPEAFKNMFDDRAYKPYQAVYAGPQFMMAYAGPQMNNNAGGFIGMMPQQPPEEKKKKCESCGAEMPDRAKFCGKCGAKFPERKFCPTCGSELIADSKFCPECGALLK